MSEEKQTADVPPKHPLSYVHIPIASGAGLIPQLKGILNLPDFKGHEPPLFTPVEELQKMLIDDATFVIEHPYVDRHYRDTYYTYYSSKFSDTGRNCIRVHIFNGEIVPDDIFPKTKDKKTTKLKDCYLGFFIIRPLMGFVMGRSLIAPTAYKNHNFLCCLMKDRVSLLGNELTVCGFPHTAQDTETHTCAESSLWSLYEYYGSKYSQYKPMLPSEIIKTIRDNADHRMFPSQGLKEQEVARCLNANGFQSLAYNSNKNFYSVPFLTLMHLYIESGIPLLLRLRKENAGHAVLVTGHEDSDIIYRPQFPRGGQWVDVSLTNKKLVISDDNYPPYHIADIVPKSQKGEEVLLYHDWIVSSFIVPLPVHMFLTAERAYDLIKEIFNNHANGLKKRGGKWISRLLLTSGYSFKKSICEHDDSMDFGLKMVLMHLALPRFIWVCELYRENEFVKDGHCSGLLIIDATNTGKTLASVIFYVIDNNRFTHNGLNWEPKASETYKTTICTYKNNLKGEWNQWRT